MTKTRNEWGLFAHDWAVDMLMRHIQQGALRHAYLFTGPAGVGRRTLAMRLAQAIQCPTPVAAGVPCRTCRVCRQIEAGQHIDLMVVQAETEGGTLKVEQVREVARFLSLKPYQAAFKVVLFLRFQEANASAQNALLKTLEEAPAYALLMLTADNPEQLLPTIVSRCEVIRLRPASIPALTEFLTTQGIEPTRARLLAHLSGGRPGYALRLSADEQALAFRSETLDELRELLSAPVRTRFAYAETLAKDKETFRRTLFVWLSFWRDVLLRVAGSQAPLTNADRTQEVEALAAQLSLAQARTLTEQAEQAIERLEKNLNARLLAEVLFVDWPKLRQRGN
ncbi:MAG: DNA polymerase III subunit delta' [Anaerolineales bacterium]|nr:DNA polymerase III subunit delta' [Anaerolineales bacterium]MDW8276994.1 DNA polymerase III subunit delta' [Anaerolineales bacterium]